MNFLIKLSLILVLFSFHAKFFAQTIEVQKTNNQKKIEQILKTIYPKANFPDLPFLINDKGVEYFKKKLAGSIGGPNENAIKINLAEQMLLAGKTEECIAFIENMMSNVKLNKYKNRDDYFNLLNLKAIAYFRLGEQLNCIVNHNTESCIYPIQGKGIYTLRDATIKAIAAYKDVLAEKPDDLLAKWLLNIGYMNLGQYPDSVPKQHFIPYNTLDSDYKLPKFKDVSPSVGLNVVDYAGSVVVEDFNNDGYLDFFMDAEGFSSPSKLFINKKDGTFEDKTASSGLEGETAGRVAVQADYNNDGFTDIFVCRGAWLTQENNYPPNSLLKNNGDGTFSDVTIEAGLLSFHPTSSANWGDYDNDGYVDLFIGNETSNPKNPHKCQLYHNNGNGTFKEVSNEVGINVLAFTKGISWGDFNNDGWLDLYVSNISPGADNYLFKNNGKDKNGKISFTDVTKTAGVGKPQFSFPTFFFDFDNDGWLDIFVAVNTGAMKDISAQIVGEYLKIPSDTDLHPILYRNNHDGTFENISDKANLGHILYAMSCTAGDIDNDGFLDIYSGTGFLQLQYLFPKVMLRNNEGKNFQNVTTSIGMGHLQKAHGIGFGDFDNDGDQDILVSLGAGFTTDVYNRTLFENPGNTNHWVTLQLEGEKSNKSALGSRIKVVVETENGDREIHQSVASTGSFGNSCLRREIGLGDAKSIKSIEVFWPASGIKQLFTDVKMDSFYKIKESSNNLLPVKLEKLTLGGASEKQMKHEK